MSKIGIGLRFTHDNKDGVILQTYNKLPKHHKREIEDGPFYGVHYEGGDYIWYNKQEIVEILKQNK
jgi:hypothetical protein|tara:strand:+ start:108 stop:305 length:198 start_codon:yes stop_codon:yes gene_type:complete